MSAPLLSISDLSVSFESEAGRVAAVKRVNLEIERGEVFGLAGESGSGKSVTAMSILRLNPAPPAQVESGRILYNGEDLLQLPLHQLRAIRGAKIAVIFQEPMTALSPLHRVGEQLIEALQLHRDISREEAQAISIEWLERVGIPDPATRANAYPFELSGGQRQRVMIAMALMLEPELIIADEPTTALDVTIQKQIFKLMLELKSRETSMLFITHDMGAIWEMCDRVAVMKEGEIVESGAVREVLTRPQHPYTQKLIAAVPELSGDDRAEIAATERPLLEVNNLHLWYPIKRGIFARTVDHVKAVNGVSFVINPGETLALVGESGCGKTSLGRTLLGLEQARQGAINFAGVNLLGQNRSQKRQMRQQLQMVFQDPYSALNPRMCVRDILTEALVVHGLLEPAQREERAVELLQEVGLDRGHLYRYPHEFSGGQRQRICIARALGLKPKLIVLDESLSALDVSIQARVLDLLQELKERHGLSYLFISHDLSVVSQVADRIAVMCAGEIVELGPPSQVIADPKHPYTRSLISAVPVLGS